VLGELLGEEGGGRTRQPGHQHCALHRILHQIYISPLQAISLHCSGSPLNLSGGENMLSASRDSKLASPSASSSSPGRSYTGTTFTCIKGFSPKPSLLSSPRFLARYPTRGYKPPRSYQAQPVRKTSSDPSPRPSPGSNSKLTSTIRFR